MGETLGCLHAQGRCVNLGCDLVVSDFQPEEYILFRRVILEKPEIFDGAIKMDYIDVMSIIHHILFVNWNVLHISHNMMIA
jgi:hypothetical protein